MFLEDILETTLYKEQSQVQKTKKILQKFTLKKISKTRTTNLAFHCLCRPFWRRQWHPTPVLLPGKSHGWRSLVGWGPRGCQESDTTEWLHFHFSLWCVGEGNGNPLQCSCHGGAWWVAVYGVTQNRTRLKQLSSSKVPGIPVLCLQPSHLHHEVSTMFIPIPWPYRWGHCGMGRLSHLP